MLEKRMGEKPKEKKVKAKVLVIGTFRPESIKAVMSDNKMPRNSELDNHIEKIWAPKEAEGWFAGPLVRLESYDITGDGRLSFICGRTDFKQYVGSRSINLLRKHGYSGISNPLSTSTALITSDGKMVIAKRMYGDALGAIDVPGGYVDPEKDLSGDEENKLDFFKAAQREVAEEVFFGKRTVTDEQYNQTVSYLAEVVCTGLQYEYHGASDPLCHPELSFVMRTVLNSSELLKRAEGINMTGEGEIQIMIVEPDKIPNGNNDNYVLEVLKRHYPNIEPDGRVTIALARRWLTGIHVPTTLIRSINEI